jgi:hypothetical protein
MPTPLITINHTTDHVAATVDLINRHQRQSCEVVAAGIVEAVTAVRHNPNHTAAQFWARVGTSGSTVIGALQASIAYLQTYAPDLINDTIVGAGEGLTVNPDGTVTLA